jgi:hypothetical protein
MHGKTRFFLPPQNCDLQHSGNHYHHHHRSREGKLAKFGYQLVNILKFTITKGVPVCQVISLDFE